MVPWTIGEKLVPRSSQMTAREFSLFVREQSWTPGSWSRLVIWNTQGAPSPSKLAPVHVTRPKSAGVLIIVELLRKDEKKEQPN